MRAPRPAIVPFVSFASALVLAIPAPLLRAQCPATYTFDGAGPSQNLGRSVSGVGDVDGDGCDDILAAAPGYALLDPNRPQGRVYLYSGATGQISKTWIGEGRGFGIGLSGAGDVDRDGTPDVLVGARVFPTSAGWGAGKVYLYSGRSGGLLRSWEGDLANAYFGDSVAGPGDLNGDGYPDIVVGQRGFDSGAIDFPGKVYAYSGATGELLWSHEGDAPGDHLGWAVAGAGDFNGDGFPDVAAGGGWNLPGHVYVYSGPTGEVLCRIEQHDPSDPQDGFGSAVAGIGDMNQDGLDDIVVGAFFAGGKTPYDDNGRAYVFAGPDGVELWRWEGELFGSYFGFSVAGPGDVTGDGVPDVAVGAYGYWGPAGYMSGRAYAFSGATGERVWYADGEAVLDTFGNAIAGVGDVDGDGLADIAAGADWHDGPSPYLANAGRVYVFAASRARGCECFARVDTGDARTLGACVTGPSSAIRSGCECSDFSDDGAVDLRDVAMLQQLFGLRR